MELGLKNKIAFVAASSQGLGKATALELANEGCIVIINGRDPETLEITRKEIEDKTTGKVFAFAGDLSMSSSRDDVINKVLNQFKKVDILVTNAGGPPAGKFEDFDMNKWEKTYNELFASVVGLVNGFLPGMKNQKWGRILAITSITVKQPVNNLILSNAVRISVAGLIKSLSNELGSYNITVNNVIPGYTETDRLKTLIEKNPAFATTKNEIPLDRFGRADEFAAAVAFLASERAGYITGILLPVDGGWIKSVL